MILQLILAGCVVSLAYQLGVVKAQMRVLQQRVDALASARQSFSAGGHQLRERLARMAAE